MSLGEGPFRICKADRCLTNIYVLAGTKPCCVICADLLDKTRRVMSWLPDANSFFTSDKIKPLQQDLVRVAIEKAIKDRAL